MSTNQTKSNTPTPSDQVNVVSVGPLKFYKDEPTCQISKSQTESMLKERASSLLASEANSYNSKNSIPLQTSFLFSEPTISSIKTSPNDTLTGAPSMASSSVSSVSPNPSLPLMGTKNDGGKPDWSLLPPMALDEVVRVLDFGAKKYAPYNWASGIKYSRVFAAAMRHLWAWWRGEDNDSETGISHLAHANVCLLFLLQYRKTRAEFDDRPVEHYKVKGTDE
jgi:hypothetical protein